MSDAIRWAVLTRRNVKRTLPLRMKGMTIYVRSGTPDASVSMSCARGEFASLFAEVPMLKHNLIVDAGGYIGTAAIAFARQYPEARILTLEPSTENFQMLQRNVAPYPNIIPVQKALSCKRGSARLLDRGTGEWGFTIVEKPENGHSELLQEVESITINDIMSEYKTNGIDIIKLDIEGGEFDLLSKEIRWIHKTNAICIELHDRIKKGCTDIFKKSTIGRLNKKMPGEKYISLMK